MSINKKKIIRTVTVPQSIGFFEEVMMRMKGNGYETVVVTSPGKELDEFKQRNPEEKIVEVPMERHVSLTKDMKSLRQMVKVLRKEKPYIVHSMTPKAGLITMIAAWLTGVPVRIHTFTGLVWPTATGFSRKVLMFTDWVTCTCATHIIPEGQGVKNDLQQYITNKPMKVLGYGNVRGLDMYRFSRRPEINKQAQTFIKEGVFSFIFVGRIVRDKGINELIEAFVKLNTKYPKTRLILVGKYEADLDPIKAETMNEIQNNSSIEAVGPQYSDDLLAYYVASDCLVFPSYREGFPNVVLEAGAMGLPSIVTDINGSREIIENSKNGLIIPSKSCEALYDAMEYMITNDDARMHMVSNARSMIESRFERSFVQKCLLDFYEEILKEK